MPALSRLQPPLSLPLPQHSQKWSKLVCLQATGTLEPQGHANLLRQIGCCQCPLQLCPTPHLITGERNTPITHCYYNDRLSMCCNGVVSTHLLAARSAATPAAAHLPYAPPPPPAAAALQGPCLDPSPDPSPLQLAAPPPSRRTLAHSSSSSQSSSPLLLAPASPARAVAAPRVLRLNRRMSSRTASSPRHAQSQRLAAWPAASHAVVAKLTASAQLNPRLNPEWYAPAFSTTNSPAAWRTCSGSKTLGHKGILMYTASHAVVAKLTASAQLNPRLNPEWYAPAFSTTHSPAAWRTCPGSKPYRSYCFECM